MDTRHFLAAAVLLMPLSAHADGLGLAIGGNYGSKEGCVYAKTGESSGADSFMLLTPDAVTTSTSYCEFKKIIKTSGDSFTVSAACQAEGEDSSADETMDISHADKNSYRILFEDGTKLGPLKKCR
jgi:hypothetical protein